MSTLAQSSQFYANLPSEKDFLWVRNNALEGRERYHVELRLNTIRVCLTVTSLDMVRISAYYISSRI
jgi:hypothetical protein